MICSKRILIISLVGFVLHCTYGHAQIGGIDSEFAGAGARPLAMGGSFLALADDSTAAEFNPAGIRILRRPEFAWQLTRTYDRRDEFLPETSWLDDQLAMGKRENQWLSYSFASYVHPGQDYTWAISQLTNIDFLHRLDDGSFQSLAKARNNAYGFTLSTDLKPRLHVGLTLRMNRFQYHYHAYRSGRLMRLQEFSDWSPSANLGVLWRATKDWSFGAVYKSQQIVDTGSLKTNLPHTFGAGVAYHPNDKLRLLADVDYLTWSEFDGDMSDSFIRDDTLRLHLGGEYLFRLEDERAWFVRGGAMREDANSFYWDGPYDRYFSEGFPKPDAIYHLSWGLGMATEKFQLDFAMDHAFNGPTILILSMVHFF